MNAVPGMNIRHGSHSIRRQYSNGSDRFTIPLPRVMQALQSISPDCNFERCYRKKKRFAESLFRFSGQLIFETLIDVRGLDQCTLKLSDVREAIIVVDLIANLSLDSLQILS